MLSNLVRDAIESVLDQDRWDESTEREEEAKRLLGVVSSQWAELTDGL